MIMRVWRGATATSDADAYVEYLNRTGLKEYRETRGNLGAATVRRAREDGTTEFLTISFWPDIETVKEFSGPDPDVAVFYPADKDFLIEADQHVQHYEVAEAAWP